MLKSFLSSFNHQTSNIREAGKGHLKQAGVAALLMAQAVVVTSAMASGVGLEAPSPNFQAKTLHEIVQQVDLKDSQSHSGIVFQNPLVDGGLIILKGNEQIDQAYLEKTLGKDYLDTASYQCLYTDQGELHGVGYDGSYELTLRHSEANSPHTSILQVSEKDNNWMVSQLGDIADHYETRVNLYHETFHAGQYNASFCDRPYSMIEQTIMENGADVFSHLMIAKDMQEDGVSKSEIVNYIETSVEKRHDESFMDATASFVYTGHASQITLSALAHLIENDQIDLSSMTPKMMEKEAITLTHTVHELFAEHSKQVLTVDLIDRVIDRASTEMDQETRANMAMTLERRIGNGSRALMPAQARLMNDFLNHSDVLVNLTEQQRHDYTQELLSINGGELSTQGNRSINSLMERLNREHTAEDALSILKDKGQQAAGAYLEMGDTLDFTSLSASLNPMYAEGLSNPLDAPAHTGVWISKLDSVNHDSQAIEQAQQDQMDKSMSLESHETAAKKWLSKSVTYSIN